MRMMYHLAYMALRMSLYPVLTIAYQADLPSSFR